MILYNCVDENKNIFFFFYTNSILRFVSDNCKKIFANQIWFILVV
jgi:hypothetical protein